MTRKITSILIICFMLIAFATQAQFSENFNSTPNGSIPAGWTRFNLDGLTPATNVNWVTNAWVAKTVSTVLPSQAMWSTSWYNPVGIANDWMFTPAILIPTTNPFLTYTVVTPDESYRDGYELRIMTTPPTETNLTSSTILLSVSAAETTPTKKIINLNSYAGQVVYIGWRNNSDDKVVLAIDDVEIQSFPDIDAELVSINMENIISLGNNSIKGTIKNLGANPITSFDLRYIINDNAISELYHVTGSNITTNNTYNFTHNIPYNFTTGGVHNVQVIISNVNSSIEQNTSNNTLNKTISVASQLVNKKTLIEGFSASTCRPCASWNPTFKTWINSHPEVNYIKYQMNFPVSGDPYYIAACGARGDYYNTSSVPTSIANGKEVNNSTSALNSAVTQANSARSAFEISCTPTYTPDKLVTLPIAINSYVTINGLKLRVAICEKTTTGNVSTNGETSFNHVLMAMLPNADGTSVNFTDGENYTTTLSQNMTGTKVEGINDLIAIIFIQDDNNKTIYQSASFDIALASYTIAASSDANGTITPSGNVSVNHGTNKTFNYTPNAGYELDALTVDNVAIQNPTNAYTFTNVIANHTINVTFKLITYTITASAEANGTITPSGTVNVNHGENKAFTISASSGYVINALTIDGTTTISEAADQASYTYTFSDVQANGHTIAATFKAATTTILSVTPENQDVANTAGTTTFAVANNGVGSMDWTAEVNASDTWLTITEGTSGTDAGTITCSFTTNDGVERTGTITVTATGATGSPKTITVTQAALTPTLSVTPANQDVTKEAGTVDFAVTSNSAWTAESDVAWCTVTASGTSDGTITATYEANTGAERIATITVTVSDLDPVLVTVTQEAYPSTLAVTPANQNVTKEAGTFDFTVSSNSAWTATSNAAWCTVTASGTSDGTITATYEANTGAERIATITVTVNGLTPITVTLTQAANTHTITASVNGANGTIDPDGISTIIHGTNKIYTMTANTDYFISELMVDNNNVTSQIVNGKYIFTNIIADHTITVTFARIPTYTITASVVGENGTISPSGETIVNQGANQVYTITPNTNYYIGEVLVDDVVVTNLVVNNRYTFTNVTADHTIKVNFNRTNIDNKINNTISIYPNPANDNITISNIPSNANITINDILGKTISSYNNISNNLSIDLTSYSKGAYFITIQTEGQTTTKKFIHQ